MTDIPHEHEWPEYLVPAQCQCGAEYHEWMEQERDELREWRRVAELTFEEQRILTSELRAKVKRLQDQLARQRGAPGAMYWPYSAEVERLSKIQERIVRAEDEVKRLRAALVQIENWVGKLPSNMGEAALIFEYISQACSVLDKEPRPSAQDATNVGG